MFQFMTATRIIFGEGALSHSLSMLNQFGYSALVVTGKDEQRAAPLLGYLKQQGMRYQQLSVHGEPLIAMVEEMAAAGRVFKPDIVIAVGGGSVMDVGKALSALIPNQGSVYDYVEVVGRALPLTAKPLPCIAVPTTAGTGSEVTRNAVLISAQENVKAALRSTDLIPDMAIIDPTLTYGTDKELSARCGMDAFTHLMEAYVCGDPNPLTDMVCEEGLRRLAPAIIHACEEDDPKARADMAFASMLGGMAQSNAKLGAAHGLAAALGGMLDAPHGAITAQLAPYVMAENILAAREAGRITLLNRYRQLAVILTGRQNAEPSDGIVWVQRTLKRLSLPSLCHYGLCEAVFDDVAVQALRSSSIKGNAMPLNHERLVNIMRRMCKQEPIHEHSHSLSD
ncbi:iron-containing alcohol dehydrogenase [Enterovibrio norvegicus]|uniref:iron-containing alcohol dehydrogenase n=1 Tax=Enterovibrio norvegicus TaxID=188144 RepID=UPI000C84847E|nr:iron-containing alcohol dehydrogenase [Enterovibrio norvegicus]PMI27711.1 alcohol dehydrogenase [Enterovibrio norvegicus]TKF11004.1 iron-containing alcohol dehydrogenase [Enterovibrio norvegicus]TKF27802.1 iron-containing alcohol dehydrogenase [Enterovibrio norvegicus]